MSQSSFDHHMFQAEFRHRLTNGNGLPADQADHFAALASECVCASNGGEKKYIQARWVNKAAVRSAYSGGASIPALTRRFGLSAAKVRDIIR
jgi:hypothetical protein